MTNSNSTSAATPAPMTASEGRKFAFPVGTAFMVLAAITWWREHTLAMQILGGLGGALLVAGVVLPSRLGPVYRAWMGLAHAISKVTTPIFMGTVYFVVMTPIALLRRTIGSNPVRHERVENSYWRPREPGKSRSDLRRQF